MSDQPETGNEAREDAYEAPAVEDVETGEGPAVTSAGIDSPLGASEQQ
jgi:hypothetical protein